MAIYAKDSIPQKDTIYYAFTDYQRNLVALTDVNGNVYQRLAYDPWGNRRNPDDWTQKAASTTLYLFNRGYTLHEHLDAFALINMSGRVYDPVLGTFLSPDPYVQAPDNWLNYNRYSYCLGNPLRYTDPTGKLTEDQVKSILNNAAAAATNDVHYECNNAGTLISTSLTQEQASAAVAQANSSGNVTQKPEAGLADPNAGYIKDGNKAENTATTSQNQSQKAKLNNASDATNATSIAATGTQVFTEANAGETIAYAAADGTIAYVKSSSVLTYVKGVGYTTLAASIVIDGTLYFLKDESGAKALMNIGVSALSTAIGGVPGLVIMGIYIYVDKTKAFDQPKNLPNYTPQSTTMPDATKVRLQFQPNLLIKK